MATIRPMRQTDVDDVRQVEAVAFGRWWRHLTGVSGDRPRRTRTSVLASLGSEPEGCFVAEANGKVVGSVFSRTWGAVGWFGSLVVLPQYQGRGIGKRLIAASVEHLRRDRNRVIGLETMPEGPDNLGLYLHMGFQARLPTMLMAKELQQPARGGTTLPCWSAADERTRVSWLSNLREAAGQIRPGLDYTKEVTSTARHGQGETLVLTEHGKAIGLSTVRLHSGREAWGQDRAAIRLLAVHPAHTQETAFRLLLLGSEELALAHGKRALTLSVNACHPWALEKLLEWEYTIERSMLRMVLGGTDGGPSVDDYVDLSRWAG